MKRYILDKISKKYWFIEPEKFVKDDPAPQTYEKLTDIIKLIPKSVTKIHLENIRIKNIQLPDWIKEIQVYGNEDATFKSFPKNLQKITFEKCHGIFPKNFASLKKFKELDVAYLYKWPKKFPESTRKIIFWDLDTLPKNSKLSLPKNLKELDIGSTGQDSTILRFPDLIKSPKLKSISINGSFTHRPTKVSKIKLFVGGYPETVPDAWKKMLIN
jgi:hypothetical protein